MTDIINADYRVVQERSPEVICSEIKTIEAQVYKTTLDGVAEIGKRLAEVKDMIGHGNWSKWCEENLGYTDRQARKYMKISEEFYRENSMFSNRNLSSDLSISKAYSLLSLPENEVESFAEEHNIHDMTVAQLKEEIREWKSKADETSALLDNEKNRNEELMKAVDEGEERRLELVNEITQLEERAANPEEIASLKKELAEEKQKAKKAEEALAAETANMQTKIDAAVNSKSDELKRAAEVEQQRRIRQLEVARDSADKRATELEKKLQQSGSEELATFKVMSKALQQDFLEMKQAIQAMRLKDMEQAEKMETALKKVLENLLGGLAG